MWKNKFASLRYLYGALYFAENDIEQDVACKPGFIP
jgi:hypothetical protein